MKLSKLNFNRNFELRTIRLIFLQNFYWEFTQGFRQIAILPILMLKTSGPGTLGFLVYLTSIIESNIMDRIGDNSKVGAKIAK